MITEIPLSEVLEEISAELKKAAENANSSGSATMQFEECEIEFAVKVEKDAKGGLKVWMLNLGGSIKKSDSNTIKIKFKKIEENPIQASSEVDGSAAPKITRQNN